ncbi:hypothetical protein EYF80_012150 [Liparis tanakae]|uniref:Uncharacterized protein n=1 Tax=Liparis tanakae TaxID=230148 RepID=A0A4Z2IHV3_9TELE|nr:hypothetical protein EYF80_012150 [Liparis tanakae]
MSMAADALMELPAEPESTNIWALILSVSASFSTTFCVCWEISSFVFSLSLQTTGSKQSGPGVLKYPPLPQQFGSLGCPVLHRADESQRRSWHKVTQLASFCCATLIFLRGGVSINGAHSHHWNFGEATAALWAAFRLEAKGELPSQSITGSCAFGAPVTILRLTGGIPGRQAIRHDALCR